MFKQTQLADRLNLTFRKLEVKDQTKWEKSNNSQKLEVSIFASFSIYC